jgi:benzoyl-CoA reductase/2-hydroxyglutaryl-CoA dehydratase subunit BcrC/BadD/HgdB
MRHDVIAVQKKLGRKTAIVLPVLYPRELLTAMDVHAVELWGPPGPPRGPDAGRIPSWVCAVVRNALAFLASGGGEDADAILFPHTCDSIQALATLAPDFGGWGKPVLRYFHHRGGDRPGARAFVRAELQQLAVDLERLTGRPLSAPRLGSALALHGEIDRLRGLLLSLRAHLPQSDRDLYSLLRRGEFLWPDEHLAELEGAAAALGAGRVQHGLPLMVSGYVPDPMDLFDRLASAGAFVAADDYAAIGRRIPRSVPVCADPFATLVDRYFALPPCPTREADSGRRMDHLVNLYRQSGSEGLILHVPKFCEPEAFDVPAVYRRFAGIGAPVLYLESELETGLSVQAVTRIEAFVELVHARRGGK